MTEREEAPLPHVPVVLLCAEDDDLELVSFVHVARQHGLEPEVVPGVEVEDKPLLRALSDNEAALFVVLRSDNMAVQRARELKRVFVEHCKASQHLLALRLEPARTEDSVQTIARRLRSLLGARPGPPKSEQHGEIEVEDDVEDWTATMVASDLLPKTPPAPIPDDLPEPEPLKTRPPAEAGAPATTWEGTEVAEYEASESEGDDDERELAQPGFPARPRQDRTTPSEDEDATWRDLGGHDPLATDSLSGMSIIAAARRRTGLAAAVVVLAVAGIAAAAILMFGDELVEARDGASVQPTDRPDPAAAQDLHTPAKPAPPKRQPPQPRKPAPEPESKAEKQRPRGGKDKRSKEPADPAPAAEDAATPTEQGDAASPDEPLKKDEPVADAPDEPAEPAEPGEGPVAAGDPMPAAD